MKRKDFLAEVRGKSAKDLKVQAKTLSEELMKLRFRQSTGQLQQSSRLGQVRRDLARVLTTLKTAENK